jgi:hypothetical protein
MNSHLSEIWRTANKLTDLSTEKAEKKALKNVSNPSFLLIIV